LKPTSKSSTSIDGNYQKLIQQLVASEDWRALLIELLAVAHRDGGQYTQLAGVAVSMEDAINRLNYERQELAKLRREIR